MIRVTSRNEPLFPTGSGSVEVHDYANYSVQLWFALCDFKKYVSGSVRLPGHSVCEPETKALNTSSEEISKAFNNFSQIKKLEKYLTFFFQNKVVTAMKWYNLII